MRQAGTWNLGLFAAVLAASPWATKYKETINNCVCQLGKVMDNKIYKDRKPNCCFWTAGAKTGYWACPLYTTLPKRWASDLNHLSSWTPWIHPYPYPYKEAAQPAPPPRPHTRKQAKETVACSFSLSATGVPIKPCLNFLSGLLAISIN